MLKNERWVCYEGIYFSLAQVTHFKASRLVKESDTDEIQYEVRAYLSIGIPVMNSNQIYLVLGTESNRGIADMIITHILQGKYDVQDVPTVAEVPVEIVACSTNIPVYNP